MAEAKVNNEITPSEVCRLVRESFHGSKVVYTQGSCFKFYEILKGIFPDALPYYDEIDGHVYTLIEGKYYDIYGELTSDLKNKLTSFIMLPNIEKCSPSWGWSLDKFEQRIRDKY